MKRGISCFCCTAFLFLFFTSFAYAQTKTTKYTYDALGRLTYVQDGVNGNRDYDYDKVGNRTLVAVATSTDTQSEGSETDISTLFTLATPTGLTVQGPLSPYGDGYGFSWNAVAGATSYEYQLRGQTTVLTTTRTDASSAGPKPYWVRAVAAGGRSALAYFP